MQRNRDFGFKLQAVLALWLAATLGIGSAASPVIGMAVAKGTFALDASKVSGNGTLFEGSVLETGKATSEVRLNNGVRMIVDGESKTRIYRDRMLLEHGTGQVESGQGASAAYRVEAAGLQIQAVSRAVAKVAMGRDNHVLVAALRGPVSVRTSAGLLVANLEPGRALEFDPQGAGAAAPVKMVGLLTKNDGHYLLTDTNSGVTVEVQGDCLDPKVGKTVEINGVVNPLASPVAGASQVVKVKGCDSAGVVPIAAKAGTAGGASGTAGTAGTVGGAVASKTIIAGVVVAGVGAATASTVALTRDEKKSISQ
ncbi:MAG: hypothetical protein JNL98_08010 [Bryobacterales bacterium]|nr:hypothetical protein [Bryobacterales bacterium]